MSKNRFVEEDDDSGADSLNDQSLQSSLCGDSSGGGLNTSNIIGSRNSSNTRNRTPRHRLQQTPNSSNQGTGYGGCSGNSRALVPYSTELVPVLTSNNCNCNINVPSQHGCLMQQQQQHLNGNGSNNTLQQNCGCFHLQCHNQLQTVPMNVERRLMQLEGDKDTLSLQVRYLVVSSYSVIPTHLRH